jgi:dihydrofolate reductase
LTPVGDTPTTFALVAAIARNGVIGANNALPWRLPADLRRFRALTTGHSVIMGRKTWDSLPRALPDRQNIVVTRAAGRHIDGATVVPSLAAALSAAERPAPVFCIGGGELYREALALADTLYLTEIDREFHGDTSFPPFDRRTWRETSRETHGPDAGGGFGYAFVTYHRVRPATSA